MKDINCYLHIGTEKTGTTSIQNFLFYNKNALSKNGVYISDKFGTITNYLIPTFFKSSIDSLEWNLGISNKNEKEKYFIDFKQIFSEEVSKAKKTHDKFIITSEHLHSRLNLKKDIKSLYNFLNLFFKNVFVICYFREQLSASISSYSTALKSKQVYSINEFLNDIFFGKKKYFFNYIRIADNWSNIFDKKNCIFKIYDKKNFYKNDIRKDFLKIIDKRLIYKSLNWKPNFVKKNTLDSSNDPINLNQSITLFQSIAFKIINHKIENRINNFLNAKNIEAKKLALSIDSKSLDSLEIKDILVSNLIDANLRNKILKHLNKINDKFFSKYFGSKNLFITNENEKSIKKTTIEKYATDIEKAINLGIEIHKIQIEGPHIDDAKEIALKIYNKEPLNQSDAITLMKSLIVFRPNADFIKNKIKEWETKKQN